MAFWNWSGAAVLFDLDGTLVDSGASVLRAWQWTAERLGADWLVDDLTEVEFAGDEFRLQARLR